MKRLSTVLIVWLATQVTLAADTIRYYGPETLNARTGQGLRKSISFTAPTQTEFIGVLTMVNGNGQDLTTRKCNGSFVAKIVCGLENAVKILQVKLLRPQSVEIVLNNSKILAASSYNPASAVIQLSVRVRANNNLSIVVKGLPTASIRLSVDGPSGPVNQPPVAAFTFSPSPATAPEILIFNASGSQDPDGSIASYEWDFGDGRFGTGVMPSHLYTQAGLYDVRLTVKDQSGASATITQSIDIRANQLPVAAFLLSQSTDIPQNIRLDAATSTDADGQIVLFDWFVNEVQIGQGVQLNHELQGTGSFEIKLTVSDNKGGVSSATRSLVIAPNINPIAQISLLSSATGPAPFSVALSGRASTDPDNDQLTYSWDFGDGSEATGMDTSHIYTAPGVYTVVLLVQDPRGGTSTAQTLIRVLNDSVVPDPKDSAPTLSNSDSDLFQDQVQFLNQGESATQRNVQAGAINEALVAVVRGKIVDEDANPIQGVKVTTPFMPQFGNSFTRADGEFDFVVNGGNQYILRFEKTGFLFSDRTLEVLQNSSFNIDDIVLVKPDDRVTQIAMNIAAPQKVESNVVSDQSGARKATLVIPASTRGYVVRPDGSKVEMANLSLRVTEYTVGESGPRKMPAPLPPSTGYTYAVDVSADEALAMGSKHIEFSKPIAYHVNNFLGFPVGSRAPVGVYDDEKAQWVGIPDGWVIRILAIEDSKAVISVSADGSAATSAQLASMGLDDDERTQLAQSYPAGTELWRIQTQKFSPVDINWVIRTVGSIPVSTAPSVWPQGNSQDHPSQMVCGSRIDLGTLTVREELPLTGVNFAAHYHSRREGGFAINRKITVPVTGGGTLPAALQSIDVEVHVAGQILRRQVAPARNITEIFDWDGLDAYGRQTSAAQARVRLRFNLVSPYLLPPTGAGITFGQPGQSLTTSNVNGRSTFELTRDFNVSVIGALSLPISRMSLAGWSLDPVHRYDPENRILHLGNGDKINHDVLPPFIETLAGQVDQAGFSSDNSVAKASQVGAPGGLRLGPDGSIYFADNQNFRLRKITPQGLLVTVMGNGTQGDSGDGGLAIDASVRSIGRPGIAADGTIYVPDPVSHKIRRISPEGYISTFAGTGVAGFSGEAANPLQAQLNSPQAVAVMPDQSVVIADRLNHRICHIGPDGLIRTIAGTGTPGNSDAATSALAANLNLPNDLVVDSAGKVIFVDQGTEVLREVQFGQIRVVTGTGISSPSYTTARTLPVAELSLSGMRHVDVNARGEILLSNLNFIVRISTSGQVTGLSGAGRGSANPPAVLSDYMAANMAWLRDISGVLFLGDGSVVLGDRGSHRIRRISDGLPSFNVNGYNISSLSGDEIYQFDSRGRHLRTLMSRTGSMKWDFSYDPAGFLTELKDMNNLVTRIERDPTDHRPLRMVAPYGQVTQFQIDADERLASVINPKGDAYAMTYSQGGLLTGFTKPNGGSNQFTYNFEGEVTRDIAPEGFSQEFTKVLTAGNDLIYTRTTSGGKVDQLSFDLSNTTQNYSSTLQANDGQQVTLVVNSTTTNKGSTEHRLDLQFARDARLGSIARKPARTLETFAGVGVTFDHASAVTRRGPTSFFDFTEVNTSTINSGSLAVSWVNTYDGSNRTDTNVSPMNRAQVIQYDALERPVRIGIPLTEDILMDYDSAGRLRTLNQGGRVVTMTYGADGLLQSSTDPLGRTTTYQRDVLGLVTKVIAPDAAETEMQYDSLGAMTGLIPPGQLLHQFSFNLAGKAVQYLSPQIVGQGNQLISDYDVNGDIESVSRPDGTVIQYVRNNEFQISSIITPQETLTFTYDASNNDSVRVTNQGNTIGGDLYGSRDRWRNSVTRITNFGGISTDDATGTAQFNYDFRGYPITETLILSGRGGSTTFPITKVIDNDGIPQQIGALIMSRDAASGRLTGTQLDAVSTVHTYNSFGEISGVTYSVGGSAIYSESYQRDVGGRITSRSVANDGSTTNYGYQYDSGARLWRVLENGNLAAEYLYSPNGRRSGGNIRGQSVNASYDVQDRLTNYNGTSYTYNPNGELIFRQASTGSTRQYLWNNRGQLNGVNIGAQNIRYIVDGFGRRIGKRGAGTMNRSWSYRNDLQISGEFDETNARKWFFVYGSLPHVPDYMVHAITLERYRLIHDHVGSVVMVVNSATGAISQSLKYDEFGRVLTDSNPGFQPFGFAGGLYDHETGLVRFGARDYDAETGRWITKDPILFNGGDPNLYGYVGNDPINFVDPQGYRGIPLPSGDTRGAEDMARDRMFELIIDEVIKSKINEMNLEAESTEFARCESPGRTSTKRLLPAPFAPAPMPPVCLTCKNKALPF